VFILGFYLQLNIPGKAYGKYLVVSCLKPACLEHKNDENDLKMVGCCGMRMAVIATGAIRFTGFKGGNTFVCMKGMGLKSAVW
jgi:hypothetical protein